MCWGTGDDHGGNDGHQIEWPHLRGKLGKAVDRCKDLAGDDPGDHGGQQHADDHDPEQRRHVAPNPVEVALNELGHQQDPLLGTGADDALAPAQLPIRPDELLLGQLASVCRSRLLVRPDGACPGG